MHMNVRIVRSSANGGTGNIIFGTIMAVLFGLSAVSLAVSDDTDRWLPMVVCAVLALLGVGLIIKGIRRNRRCANSAGSIPEFDADTPDIVQDRIRELMQEGAVPGVTVSRTIKRVTYTSSDGTTRTTETTTESQSGGADAGNRKGNVTCPACGGIASLRRGENGICEYCGSHIQG
jgi:hypothetical protein